MTVIDSTGGELAAPRRTNRKPNDRVLILGTIVVLQLAWFCCLGYVVYRVI